MAGRSLREQGITGEIIPRHTNVKEAVFPFTKFPGVDIVLGPEMKSTGEVMGIDANFGLAYAKAQMAAQPVVEEIGDVLGDGPGRDDAVEGLERKAEQTRQRQVEPLLDQDPQHADRRAPQSERILVAGGQRADAEQSGERFELVGERDRLRHGTFRKRIACEARPVVLLDRGRDRGRFAVVLRVVAAHEALQLGKFADHLG